MFLPQHISLPVHRLAACFNHTVNSYKFYWFLAVLDAVEQDKVVIAKKQLFAGMVANAWYTVNYFHLSLGKQDQIGKAIDVIKTIEPLSIDEPAKRVSEVLENSANKSTRASLKHFDNEVPHRFLSPWFNCSDWKKAYGSSRDAENQALYALYDDHIEINPQWFEYLKSHSGILKEFTYWNLAIFLQSRNPYIPGIPNKLIRSDKRESLQKQRKNYWDIVIKETGPIQCIYTNQTLTVNDYHLEHFIPYSFLTHNLVWNLIPADKAFNCSKSNKLPSLDVYFDKFYELQRTAVDIMQSKYQTNKYLEDYLTLFSTIDRTADLSGKFTASNFRERLEPLITIAANNGFEYL